MLHKRSTLLKITLSTAMLFASSSLFAKSYGEIYPIKKQMVQQPVVMQQQSETIEPIVAANHNFNSPKHYEEFEYGVHQKLNNTILELADKLLLSSRINTSDMGEIAITSFVDLHKLNKTTHFGRTLGETMFDELFIRGFNVSEFRGQSSLTVNSKGEYYITRDVAQLNKSVPNKYVLVGTYTNIEDHMLINARILNNTTGKIVASARAYYNSDDCKLLENCLPPRKIKINTFEPYGGKNCVSGICEDKEDNQRSTIGIKAAKADTAVKTDKTKQMVLTIR